MLFLKHKTNFAVCISGSVMPRWESVNILKDKISVNYSLLKTKILDFLENYDVYCFFWDVDYNYKLQLQNYLDLLKPKSYLLQKQIQFSDFYSGGGRLAPKCFTASMLYSMMKANNLIQGNYTWVIRTRPDLDYQNSLDIKELKNSNVLYLPRGHEGKSDLPNLELVGYNDSFAVGSQDIMNTYSNCYRDIGKILKNKSKDKLVGPHRLLKDYLQAKNIKIERIILNYKIMARTTRI